jgi:hypothetical protein
MEWPRTFVGWKIKILMTSAIAIPVNNELNQAIPSFKSFIEYSISFVGFGKRLD